jgi:serine protease AprX
MAVVLYAVLFTGIIPDTGIPNSEWAFEMTEIRELNAAGRSGSGVVVCIVDTGIDVGHPNLDHVTILAWRDFVGGRSSPYDDQGHGTAMAGLIVGDGQVRGASPAVSLLVAKAIGANGQGTDADVAAAIDFCVDPNGDGNRADGADIVSLSLGGGTHPIFGSAVADAANNAIQFGVFIVAAAGNDGQADDGEVEVPAREPLVIAVGAVDRNGLVAAFSSRGRQTYGFPIAQPRTDPDKKPELVAPGVDLVAPWPGGQYVRVSGTSPATAIVAGGLALLLESHPELRKQNPTTIESTKTALMNAARTFAGQSLPHDDRYGYGLFQAASAESLL